MTNGKANFTNFKVHTQYSICEGAIKIDSLKSFCKERKIRSVGLSDTSNLCGALEFSENLSKSGTQPIVGTQINFKHAGELGLIPLIAKSEKGYKSIIELSSKSFLDRLILNDERIKSISDGLREIIKIEDPVGQTMSKWDRPNGLNIDGKLPVVPKDSFKKGVYY